MFENQLFQERGLAARLLPLPDKACPDDGESSEEQTRLVTCLREAVTMEAARLLSQICEIELRKKQLLQVVGGDWTA